MCLEFIGCLERGLVLFGRGHVHVHAHGRRPVCVGVFSLLGGSRLLRLLCFFFWLVKFLYYDYINTKKSSVVAPYSVVAFLLIGLLCV